MGRPPLPVGTWGAISTTGSPGRYRARTRFRDYDGVTRPVERWGTTKGAARSALTAALADRSAPSGSDINGETRLSELASVWLADREAEGRLATNTLRRYREVTEDHVLPGVGNLRLREATVSRLDRFVKKVKRDVGPPTARLCSTCLSGMLGLAVRHDALPSNPMRGVGSVTVVKKEPRALTLDEVAELRRAVYAWQTTPKRGRPPGDYLLDVIDLMLATGARVGEILALRWADIDLDAGRVTITGTVVMSNDTPSRPVRQGFPKGKRPRGLLVPRFAVDTLLHRRVTGGPDNHLDAVLPSAAGTWRDPGNVRKALTRVLADTGFSWVTPHTFRRTVATLLAHDGDTRAAADQLGHTDDTVTKRHYIQPLDVARDQRDVLGRFVV